MRVSIVTDTYPPEVNGVARTLRRLAEGLRRLEWEVEVLHPGRSRASRGVDFHVASVPLPGYPGLRLGLPAPIRLRQHWGRWRPDVVYVATESPWGSSAIRVAGRLGVPAASGYHTHFPRYAADYRLGAFRRLAETWLRSLHNRTACTFAPAADVARALEAGGYRNVRALGRGVDAGLFHPLRRREAMRRSWGAGPDDPVAIVVGRLAAEKNLDLAVEAFRAMRLIRPGLRCVMVGDGPRRAELERDCPDVHFAGMRDGVDLATHYASADIFLFPSLSETFGNVLLEALASGLVTVSFKYAASAEHVLHPENGLQAAYGKREEFVEQACRAVDLAWARGLRGRARATGAAAGWEAVVLRFAADLRRLAGGPSVRPLPENIPLS